jgi:GNAT superfamily N-acetyltransferase
LVVKVRIATVEDLPSFRYVGFVTWPPTYEPIAGAAYVVEKLDAYWSEDALLPSLVAGNALVAADGPIVVGVSEVGDLGVDLALWKLYVLPLWQGQGVGTLLLKAVIETAAARDRSLFTQYVPDNSAAGEFYARHGFQRESEPTDSISPVWMRLGNQPG